VAFDGAAIQSCGPAHECNSFDVRNCNGLDAKAQRYKTEQPQNCVTVADLGDGLKKTAVETALARRSFHSPSIIAFNRNLRRESSFAAVQFCVFAPLR
jgi:hypothetical protein